MGNCRSSTSGSSTLATTTSKQSKKRRRRYLRKKRSDHPPAAVAASTSSSSTTSTTSPPVVEDATSTSVLVRSFFAIAEPVLRRVISKRLMETMILLRDEVPMEEYDDDCDDNDLPIQPILFDFREVRIIDPISLHADMVSMPKFAWPERDRVEQLLQQTQQKQQKQQQQQPLQQQGTTAASAASMDNMVVLDVMDFDGQVRFHRGVEVAVPVKGPFGSQMELEIGSGGKIDEAWVRIKVPQLRIWYVHDSKKLYLAFLARPDLIPFLNVNVDRGKGDFGSINFTEEGALDDAVENILSGFGPNLGQKNPDILRTSLVGDTVGKLVVQALGRFKRLGNGRPLELTLEKAIQKSIDRAMGKPRPVESIKADIKRLEAELERSEREYKSPQWREDRLQLHKEEKKEDDGILFCGIPTTWCCGMADSR